MRSGESACAGFCCFSFLKLCAEAAQVLGLKIAFTLVLSPSQYNGTLVDGVCRAACALTMYLSLGVQMDLEVTCRHLCSPYSRPGTSTFIQSDLWVSLPEPMEPNSSRIISFFTLTEVRTGACACECVCGGGVGGGRCLLQALYTWRLTW